MNIYVGNLSSDVTGDDLRQAFGAFGQVESANVITDKFSGESKGFGFVEMPSKEEATAAIAGMNGKDIKGRAVSVNEARPKTDRGGGRGRGGYGGGGGGRGGYGGGGRSGDRGPRGGGGGGGYGGGGGGRRY
jgi:RNA recognition motif-containing protein